MNGHRERLLAALLVVGVSMGLSAWSPHAVGAARPPGHRALVRSGPPLAGRAVTWPPGLAVTWHRTMARGAIVPTVAATAVLSGTSWMQQAELTSTAQTPNDAYGAPVAVSGNTAVVAAPGTPYPLSYGAVYIFTRTTSGVWQQQAELLDPQYGQGHSDMFGIAVALQGNTLVVGANNATSPISYTGATYVYTRSGSTWTLQETLTASDAAYNDAFGFSVALWGTTIVVGAMGKNDGAGAAYVFSYNGRTWSQQAELRYPGHVLDAEFGWAVAVWGNTLVVGAPLAPLAYLYVRSGTTWALHTLLYAPHAPTLFFGIAVAVWGGTVLVGACCDLANRLPGAVYVFGRVGNAWQVQTVLTPTNGLPADQFGGALALSGNTAVIGGAGAYVFEGSGVTWTQTQLIPPDRAAYAIGIAVAVQGNTALVGATGTPPAGYVFVRSGTDWNVADTMDTTGARAHRHAATARAAPNQEPGMTARARARQNT